MIKQNYKNENITREKFIRYCTFDELAEVLADLVIAGKPFNNQNMTTKEYVMEWLQETINSRK